MSKMHSGHSITFLCDQNLGRLARWLRIMGFDAEYMREWDRKRIEQARSSERIFLTRKRSMAGKEGCIVIESDHLDEQIAYLDRVLDLEEKIQPFTRCSICNLPLKCVKADDVKNQVPEYVFATHEKFARCPGCSRIYWKGTHPARSAESLKNILRAREDK
jgi:uncharacterized protein